MSGPSSPNILVVADLFFASKLKGEVQSVGYDYKAAIGIKTALLRAKESGPSAIVIELSKQNLDFESLITRLKEDGETQAIPLIGFCGHMETPKLQRAQELGCVVCSNGQISDDFKGVLSAALAGN